MQSNLLLNKKIIFNNKQIEMLTEQINLNNTKIKKIKQQIEEKKNENKENNDWYSSENINSILLNNELELLNFELQTFVKWNSKMKKKIVILQEKIKELHKKLVENKNSEFNKNKEDFNNYLLQENKRKDNKPHENKNKIRL